MPWLVQNFVVKALEFKRRSVPGSWLLAPGSWLLAPGYVDERHACSPSFAWSKIL
jgi:hypothetical protein